MQITALPPRLVAQGTNLLHAIAGDISSIDPSQGSILQTYRVSGVPDVVIENNVFYMNINDDTKHTVFAVQTSDGITRWDYHINGRLVASPVIKNDVVYTSTVEGEMYALRASDGVLLWKFSLELGLNVPSFLGPIVMTSPTVIDDILYMTAAANPPFTSSIQAWQTRERKMLWKASLADIPLFPVSRRESLIYINTLTSCSAFHATDGSRIWESQFDGRLHSSSIVGEDILYLTFAKDNHAFLCALHAHDGSVLWQTQIGDATRSQVPTEPVVTTQAVYAGTDKGSLVAIGAKDGGILWERSKKGKRFSSPVVTGETVCVGADDRSVSAFRAENGAPIWEIFLDHSLGGGSLARLL